MEDFYDVLETVGHLIFTYVSVAVSNWHSIGGAVLMLMQGAYLYKKLKEKK